MRIIHTKITLILIIAVIALTVTAVFAADDYNSSRSNTSTAIVNQQVGDILLRYGIGGAEINNVTDALVVGVSKVELKATLIEIGIGEEGVNEVFTKLDEFGAGFIKVDDQEKAVSTPSTGDAPQPATGEVNPINRPDTVAAPKEDEGTTIRKLPGRTKYSNITLERGLFHDSAMNVIRNIRSAAPEERENLLNELRVSRGTFKTEILSMSLSTHENAKVLRENFRENVKTVIGHVDHGKTARIAVAHGKGLRMLNRFRSAMARFDHILSRLESRIKKFEVQGVDVSSTVLLIEEAKNMSVENEAKMEELKAKYESLLLGENAGGIAEEARAIAAELKTETQNLHAKLRDIVDEIKQAAVDYNSSRSNTSI